MLWFRKAARILTLFSPPSPQLSALYPHEQFTYIVAGAGGYWRLHTMAEIMGAKVTPPFRQQDDPEVTLENYVVEIQGDLITARYVTVARPHESPDTPPKVADLFQVKFKPNKLVR
jgi:hypothetical protein